MSDCLTLQKFTPFLGGHGLLLEQLLGNGLKAFAHNNTLDVLSRSDSDIETLRWFQAQLNQTTTDSFPVSLDEERSFFYDFIQPGYTDDSNGNGRILVQGIPLAINNWQDIVGGIFLMNFPDRREALARVNRYFEQPQALFDETPYRRRNDPVSFESTITSEEQSAFLNILMPAYDHSSEMPWRIIATHRAIQTILILKIYQKEKGVFSC